MHVTFVHGSVRFVIWFCLFHLYLPRWREPVDGLERERFQVRDVLLAICKVNLNPLDVQWNSWWFETLAREQEHARLIAEERWIR